MDKATVTLNLETMLRVMAALDAAESDIQRFANSKPVDNFRETLEMISRAKREIST